MLTPEERLDKDFHEVYMRDGTRVTIFRRAMVKKGQDVIIFRRYVVPSVPPLRSRLSAEQYQRRASHCLRIW